MADRGRFRCLPGGSLDATGGRTTGRRAAGGHGVRSARERHPQDRIRGRMQTLGGSSVAPAVVEASPELELRRAGAEGTANLVYRAFTRIGDEKSAGCQDSGTTEQMPVYNSTVRQVKNRFLLKYANWNATN